VILLLLLGVNKGGGVGGSNVSKLANYLVDLGAAE